MLNYELKWIIINFSLTFPPNSTKFAKFCKHLATITKLRVADGEGCSLTRPNCLGLSNAGHKSRKNIKPETTLVRTKRSSAHFDTTAFCRQPQMNLTERGHASGDMNMLSVT